MIRLDQPLDTNQDPVEAEDFLSKLQGNILKNHGRHHTAHLILRFKTDSASVTSAKQWIAEFAHNQITSAQEQRRGTSLWKARDNQEDCGEFFASFLLSATGYNVLGLTERMPADPDFRRTMLLPQDGLRSDLDAPYNGDIHAMVLLAYGCLAPLNELVESVEAELKFFCEIVHKEAGKKLQQMMGGKLIAIEHFGYADGISQPLMIKEDIDAEIAERGNEHWDPAANLALALVEEQTGSNTYGSYMVFRKLEQNVSRFKELTEQLADRMGLTGADRTLAGALAVGRHKDGTPVMPTTVVQPGASPNDFNYDSDVDGKACPFHAHIRKTNPRGDLERRPPPASLPLAVEKTFRIVRRGITYGDRPDLADDASESAAPPDKDVGLLFMCFQSRLVNFTIQQDGSDSNDFVRPGVGVDAIIGRNSNPTPQTWPTPGSETQFTLANLVSFKGGEYFFAPSLPFLKSLDTNNL